LSREGRTNTWKFLSTSNKKKINIGRWCCHGRIAEEIAAEVKKGLELNER
jgi:hypothetical protein